MSISSDAKDFEPLLHDVVATFRTTVFVIDEFNECSKDDRIVILKTLYHLVSSSQSIIKIFLSSYKDIIGDIDRVLSSCQQVAMDCKEAHADILTYVNDMIEVKLKDSDLEIENIQLKQDILNALIRGANGM